jgi:hypothetical protein
MLQERDDGGEHRLQCVVDCGVHLQMRQQLQNGVTQDISCSHDCKC